MVEPSLMLQVLIRAMLLIEATFYFWLVVRLRRNGVEPVMIAAIIVAIASCWRLSHSMASWLVAATLRWRDGRSLPIGNSLAGLMSELRAWLVSYNWSQAFPQQALGDDPIGKSDGTPILLVHGFFSNRGMWVRFRKRLADAGLGPVYTVTLEPMTGTIDQMVEVFAARLAEVQRETGAEKIIVVAHSMGGLVTRAHMAQAGAGSIRQFITLGSPHHGTQLAGLGLFKCATQMRHESPWIETLADMEEASPHGVPTLSIYTLNDDLVYPPESAELAWAENVPVSGIGHVGLMFSEVVTQRVIAAIRKPALLP
ncbi:MAG: alpha/beta fold hydrolase [Betaproteobacteria bacterium]